MRDGCWEWTSTLNINGYATLGVKKRRRWTNIRVHRFMYERHNGKLKRTEVVRHKCDNPVCVNPDHLEKGTQQDNMRDMVERKRQAVGERHGMAELTWSLVSAIRGRLAAGGKQRRVAEEFGINQATVSRIANNKIWKVEDDL